MLPDLATWIRFWDRVEKGPSCWNWMAGKDRGGYGRILIADVNSLAHVFSYRMTVGTIPKDIELHHLCENPACVNPAHLVPKTTVEHMHIHGTSMSEINRRKTHCKHGHEFTAENTVKNHNPNWRGCRECHRISSRRRHARRKTTNTARN